MKRLVIASDFHCGHVVGLTHPDFDAIPSRNAKMKWKLYHHRRECWEWVSAMAEALQPIDALLVNGDLVDGKGVRSGSTEQLATDRTEQVEMAVAATELFKADKVLISYGTPYHTGSLEDWENEVARQVSAVKIGGHDVADVNGLLVDYRHHVGRSSVPHGRFTAVARERLWGLLWSERGEFPKADVIVRSHVHYFVHCGEADWLAIITPALQGYGSKYGVRQCVGTVDFGLVWLDVENRDSWTWDYAIKRFVRQRHQVVSI